LLANFDSLVDAPNGLQRLRELVLELAVRGKLVEQDPEDEPAKAILGRIQSERARQVTTKKKHSAPSMPVSQAECPFDIPDPWVWARASQLGIVNPRNDGADEAMVAFVPMAVLSTDYRAQIRPEVRLWKEIKKGYTHLADGDIAIAKITPCFENGKAAVFENLPGGYGAGTTELHVLRPIPGTIDPHFFLLDSDNWTVTSSRNPIRRQ
jgi:type I restriction enzyme S subunit